MTRAAPARPSIEAAAHAALQLGRVLLGNGADTTQVEEAVIRLAAAYGYAASLLPGYEGLLLTIASDGHFRTKLGRRIPAMNVGMGAVLAANRLVEAAEAGALDATALQARLDAIERAKPPYPGWLVTLGLGLTAASLARLFGGDWGAVVLAGIAGVAGTWLRQALGRRRFAPVLVAFAAALASGLIGAAGARLGATATPVLCLVAPGMIIMPGVPLINGVQDLIRNNLTVGLARLGFGALVTAAIGLGLVAATLATGTAIPVDFASRPVGLGEDVGFAALAALGYALLFGVPPRLAWLCLLCGTLSFSMRALLAQLGVPLAGGTLAGALLVGLLAQFLSRRLDVPAATFAFPGVVAMVPGFYAFRAMVGAMAILSAGASAKLPLLAETASLVVACLAMVSAIAVGVAAPVLLFHPLMRPVAAKAVPRSA